MTMGAIGFKSIAMKRHLFYTFLGIFAVTSFVTLLGITRVIQIPDGYLTALVTAFLVESAGAVVALFRRAEFFTVDDAHHTEINAQLESRHAAEIAQFQSENTLAIERLTRKHSEHHQRNLETIGTLRKSNFDARGLGRRIIQTMPRQFRPSIEQHLNDQDV